MSEIIDISSFSLKEETEGFSEEKPYRWLCKSFPHRHIVRMHYHDSLELNLFHRIEGEVRLNHGRFPLSDKTLLIIPPGHAHSYDILPGQEQMLILHIALAHIRSLMNTDELMKRLGLSWETISFLPDDSLTLTELCHELVSAEYDLTEFLNWILSFFKALAVLSPVILKREVHNNWLQRVICYAEQNVAGSLSLGNAAREAGFSSSYFSRKFREVTGMNYKDYVLVLRMDKARSLLISGLNVSETSGLCGFEDISYFIRVFHRHFDVTPGQLKP